MLAESMQSLYLTDWTVELLLKRKSCAFAQNFPVTDGSWAPEAKPQRIKNSSILEGKKKEAKISVSTR